VLEKRRGGGVVRWRETDDLSPGRRDAPDATGATIDRHKTICRVKVNRPEVGGEAKRAGGFVESDMFLKRKNEKENGVLHGDRMQSGKLSAPKPVFL